MEMILNLDKKRVCDLSYDKKVVVIKRKDCTTIIMGDDEGRLHIINRRDEATD